MARPTIYSEELALEICEQLAQGKSLRSICDNKGMPSIRTVMSWRNSNNQFLQQYARAREDQADYYAEELIKLADSFTGETDTITAISRAKLQIDTRKWVASKLKPKMYGDKVQQELTSQDNRPIRSVIVIPASESLEVWEAKAKKQQRDLIDSAQTKY